MNANYTPEEDDLILQLKQQGLTFREIGNKIGRSRQATRGRYRALQKDPNYVHKSPEPPTSKKSSTMLSPNEMVIEGTDKRIHTLDQLLEYCNVDKEIWEVERWVANKWEVGAKTGEKDLTFDKGIISGKIKSDGGLTVEPLIQIKAWLIRKNPVSYFPILQPIQSQFKFKKVAKSQKQTHGKALIIPDIHVGFWRDFDSNNLIAIHDRQALDIVLQIVQHYTFDQIVFLGDILDLAEWTDKFIRSPELTHTTQPAITELFWWLAQIRNSQQDAEMTILAGNHEQRMDNQIITHLKSAYRLRAATRLHLPPALSVPNLLSLSELGIEYLPEYPDEEVWINSNLRCEHGRFSSSTPGGTARLIVDNYSVSTITGHNHRIEQANKTIFSKEGSRTITGFTAGCLIKLQGKIPARYRNQNWQNGFATVEYTENEFNIYPISINNSSIIYNGGYEARGEKEIAEQIESDMDFRVT